MIPSPTLAFARAQDHRPRVVALWAPSPSAANATWRAALVARDLGACLHVLHPAAEPRGLARSDAQLRALTDEIADRTRLEVVVEAVRGDVLRRAIALSEHAAMLVLPSARGNPLREWVMGTPAERLIRLCRSSVLVVKRPALASYRRVLVAVDLDAQAARLAGLGCSLSRGRRTDVVHVVDVADEKLLREVDGSGQALQSFRQHRAQRAYAGVHQALATLDARAAAAEVAVEFGAMPAAILQRQREAQAELMVIGKTQRGLLADYFLGRSTQQVLAQARADVLVHPWRRNSPVFARAPVLRAG